MLLSVHLRLVEKLLMNLTTRYTQLLFSLKKCYLVLYLILNITSLQIQIEHMVQFHQKSRVNLLDINRKINSRTAKVEHYTSVLNFEDQQFHLLSSDKNI